MLMFSLLVMDIFCYLELRLLWCFLLDLLFCDIYIFEVISLYLLFFIISF